MKHRYQQDCNRSVATTYCPSVALFDLRAGTGILGPTEGYATQENYAQRLYSIVIWKRSISLVVGQSFDCPGVSKITLSAGIWVHM